MAWKHTLVLVVRNPGRTYLPRGQAEPLDIGPELRLAAGAGELQPRGQLPPRPGPGHRYDAVPSSLGGGTVPWGGGEEGEEEDEEVRGRRRRRPHHGVRAQEGPRRCCASTRYSRALRKLN